MPTFTTIALENLLEHRKPDSNSSTFKHPLPSLTKPTNDLTQNEQDFTKSRNPLNHVFISPSLYTTPEPTPILDYSSSGSVSSSPYVFNRKGRGGGGVGSVNRKIDGFQVENRDGNENDLVVGGGQNENCHDEEEVDEFVDPRCDSLSVASSSEFNDPGRLLGFENVTHVGEFYDAIEDFSSDGSMLSLASCSRNIESELHTTRLSLFEEIEKRKTAEDDLAAMSTHWQRVGNILLSQTGFPLLAPSNDGSRMRIDINAIKQFSEEVIVARFVSEATGKAEAQAEAELAADVIIGSKDKEISRLKDRLQYYEAMIHEMSQKNLESMEVARRQRDRKRGLRKWLWSCIGMSIVIGASVVAYSYAPQHQLLENVVGDTQPDVGND
uniref:Uncharacterized protein n=1 Tax=Tanacetum cinerariifolium TaxID=118510 RepID=A0A699H0I2_TANCI|nr:uncharacterized protein [Tanacetum cinerariifolium]